MLPELGELVPNERRIWISDDAVSMKMARGDGYKTSPRYLVLLICILTAIVVFIFLFYRFYHEKNFFEEFSGIPSGCQAFIASK